MNTCKDCKFWDYWDDQPDGRMCGTCTNDRLETLVIVYDDSLPISTTTDFGCIFFEKKAT